MAIFCQQYGNLERGLRQAHHHLKQAGIQGFPAQLAFSDFLPWLKQNTPEDSFQSCDAGLSARSSGKKKCYSSLICLTARPRIKRTRGKTELLVESKSVSYPLPGMDNPPNEDASRITPTVHPCVYQPGPLTGDGNSAPFDLAYLVRASIPPPVIQLQYQAVPDNLQHDEYNNSNAAFFNGQYSPQRSFLPSPDSQFVGASDYGHPSPFVPSSVYQYSQNPPSNPSDPRYQYPHIDYQQIHHQPQMHTNHGHGSDDGNTSNNPSFYPS